MVSEAMLPRAAVKEVEARLTAAGCPDADFDARELFRLATGRDVRLSDRPLDAAEAEKAGLVARVIPADRLLQETLAAAEQIAGYSLPVVMMIKECINRSYESSLAEGLLFERRTFHSVFALADQKEGMSAFVEKRKPSFSNR